MQLLYGTTSSLFVTITERFFGGRYYLYFADRINADPPNPPSSNPLRILFDYAEIFRTYDVKNPKFVAHQRGVRGAIHKQISDPDTRKTAEQTIRALHIHGMQPYLAILEVETYLQNHYAGQRVDLESFRRSPPVAGSPMAIEYFIPDIRGPNLPDAELHLQKMYL